MSQVMQQFIGHHKGDMDVIQGAKGSQLMDCGFYSLNKTKGEVTTKSDEGEKTQGLKNEKVKTHSQREGRCQLAGESQVGSKQC